MDAGLSIDDPRSQPLAAFFDLLAAPAPTIASAVFDGLDAGGVGLCVCDERDTIRYANSIYRSVFLTAVREGETEFAHSLTQAIHAGGGLKLQTMSVQEFEPYVRRRRREQVGTHTFTTDTVDGRWWWVTDTKLPSGWLVCVTQDISSLKKKELELQAAHALAIEEACTDFLTGIPNRRQGLRGGEALFHACAPAGGITVAVLDIDHFKAINDRHGHNIGDVVLTRFAASATAALGLGDQLSRIGGEEFLLVTPKADPAYCLGVLSRIRASLPSLVLEHGAALRYTISAGCAAFAPGDTWPRLLQRADAALYRAKSNGRDRVEKAISFG